jgi:prolyl 4-hydroxylase
MARLIRFAPQLGHWLAGNLDRGQGPAALVDAMRQQGMEAHAAEAIVAATVEARRRGVAPPVDSVELPDDGPAKAVARLAPGTRIDAGDREIVVHMRTEDPVVATLGNVLDADECRTLIEMARPRLEPSTLVDPATGRDAVSDKRSSWGMFFRLEENEFIARLDRRLSLLMNLPLEHGEGLQVLHYPTGAGSEPHFDYLQPTNAANR